MRQIWDKLLMANLLFLACCFAWLVFSATAFFAFKLDWGWGLFNSAWKWVINPSLGIFFLGVVVSFIQSKLPLSPQPPRL